LAFQTIGTVFTKEHLGEILHVLEAYGGELARNDYRRLVEGRAMANSVLAPERIFGFGAASPTSAEYIETLCEVVCENGWWNLGSPQWLDPVKPLITPTDEDIGEWLSEESLTSIYGPPGGWGVIPKEN
jgi:hypothetical protein